MNYGLLVLTRKQETSPTSRVDVAEERSARREEITQASCLRWMQRQGAAHGFSVEQETFQVVAHYRERIPRRNAAPALTNCGELVGLLTVIDGHALGRCLSEGLGASRSFGCGLPADSPGAC